MTKLYFAALLAAVRLAFVNPSEAPSAAPNSALSGVTAIASDLLIFTDTGVNVNIFGATCSADAHGLGKYPSGTIKYNCLQTGYYLGYDFAIGCGQQNSNKSNVVCQAWRAGGNITSADGLASTTVSCNDIVAGECSAKSAYCPYNCSANMCAAFPGVQWFTGGNYLAKSLFPAGSTGTPKIIPKRLTINGKAKVNRWRKMTTSDLCFYASKIDQCHSNPKFTSWTPFLTCLEIRLSKSLKYGWIDPLDYGQIIKGVESSGLYPGVATLPKLPTKKSSTKSSTNKKSSAATKKTKSKKTKSKKTKTKAHHTI